MNASYESPNSKTKEKHLILTRNNMKRIRKHRSIEESMDKEFERIAKSKKGEAVIFIVFAFAIGVWIAGQIRLKQETKLPKKTIDEIQSVANSGSYAR